MTGTHRGGPVGKFPSQPHVPLSRRQLTAVALAVLLASVLAAVLLLVHVHGWRDVTIGGNSRYCGVAIRHVSVELYCEHAR